MTKVIRATLLVLTMVFFGCGAKFAFLSKYASPESTLEIYKEAVMKGDVEAVQDCFAEYVKGELKKRLDEKSITIEDMRKFVRSIKDIELMRRGINDHRGLFPPAEFKEYRIVTEKGKDGFIIFYKMDKDWKIMSLPLPW